MKKYFLIILLVSTGIISRGQPPNNAIFFGGSGDGSSFQNYSPVGNSIYNGGVGDGFANETNNITANTIFLGGDGDGFAHNNYNPGGNNIFVGGEGDGWHAVIFPMGPLPVQLVSFYGTISGETHLLKWQTSTEINSNKFEVQRSSNGIDFVTIGEQKALGTIGFGTHYSFYDRLILDGNNFYRLKIWDKDGSYEYSNIVLLKHIKGLQVSIYPNPTANILNVRISDNSFENQIDAAILDASGKLLLQTMLKKDATNKIDVSFLAPGVYSIRYIINQTPVVIRFVKTHY